MLHTISVKNRKKKRLGRGGNKGKNCGHGRKGQKSRAGHRIRPAIRDEIQRIPKRRGHNKNRGRTVRNKYPVRTVTLNMLSKNFNKDETVSPSILTSKNLIAKTGGKIPEVKIVATGEIKIPLVFKNIQISASAKKEIEKAGGSIQ